MGCKSRQTQAVAATPKSKSLVYVASGYSEYRLPSPQPQRRAGEGGKLTIARRQRPFSSGRLFPAAVGVAHFRKEVVVASQTSLCGFVWSHRRVLPKVVVFEATCLLCKSNCTSVNKALMSDVNKVSIRQFGDFKMPRSDTAMKESQDGNNSTFSIREILKT